MKKNFLIGFIIAIISIIPIYNIKASDLTLKDLPDLPIKPVDTYKYYSIINDNDVIKLYYHTNVININGQNNSIFDTWSSFYNLSYPTPSLQTGSSYYFSCLYYKLVDNAWKYIGQNYSTSIRYSNYNINKTDMDNNPKIITPYIKDYILYTNINRYYYNSTTKEYILVFSPNDVKKTTPIEYTKEKLKTDDGNLDYYKFHIFTSNYNSEYRYMYKFSDTLAFKDISMYLDDEDGYDIQLYSNDTLYLAVYDLSNNLIYSTTYTVTDLYDNVSKPTADIEVGYITNDNNLSQANIHFKFYNYDTSYKYQYSYNDKDYTQISYSDIKNKQYDLVRYSNGTVYLKILDKNDNVIFKKSALIDGILQDENNYYRYVFTIDDLYNKEQNKLLYYVFYYENIKNRGITPLITFTTEGTKVPDLHINMNNNVLDMNSYLSHIKENEISSNINSCTSLPYEYLDTNLNLQSYTSYTAFNFMACIDLENFLYGTDYTDFKLIITSNIDLHLGESIYFNGVLRPSTNDPSKNGFTSEFKIFSDMFNKAIKRFWTVLVEIIQNVTLFFNSLSPILQDFYIVIFVLVLFIFIMKFIL